MSRIRIGKDTELSATPRSIVITDAANEQQYVPPGTAGQTLTIVAGVPTWVTPASPSEFEQFATPAALPVTGAADVIYYTTSDNQFRIWNGTAYVIVPTPANFGFSVAGDTGSDTVTNGETITVVGGTGVTSAVTSNTITLNLDIRKDKFENLTTGSTVTAAATPATIISVTRNGLEQLLTTDYTISGAVLTFTPAFGISGGAQGSESVIVTYIA